MNMINTNDHSPLYVQLSTILKGKIVSGEYAPGSFLPTENDLSASFGVSRVTVRNALDLLEKQNLVVKKKGSGTYIKPPLIDQPLNTVVYFDQDMLRLGKKAETTMLRNVLVTSDPYISEALGIPENTKMNCIVRLRFADGGPLCMEMAYLIHDKCPGVLNMDFSKNSLRKYLESEYDIRWNTASQRIYAISASPEIAPLLNLKRGDPILYIERVSYDQHNAPLEYLMAYYRGDSYSLTTTLNYNH